MGVNRKLLGLLATLMIHGLSAPIVQAVPIVYSNRVNFEAQLTSFVTDNYSSPAYFSGDVSDGTTFDIHSNAQMSAIFGETAYTSTGGFNEPTGWNIIFNQVSDPRYCTGCNGSLLLEFGSTSFGDPSGVQGAAFDFNVESPASLIYAFVTLGDGSTFNSQLLGSGFFGVIAPERVSSIHVGGFDGSSSNDSISIDNLTIGAIPEPSILALLGIGLAGVGLARKTIA